MQDRPTLSQPVDLAYSENGEGTPLVLLHGFPFNHSIWRAQVEALSGDCRIITPDLRGHGDSPAPDGAYTMALMAQDVIALLDRLHIEKAIIVGHSMGGYVTLAAWRLAPERFQGFGVVASHHKADPEQKQRDRYALAEAVEERGAEAALNPNLFSPSTPESSPARALVEQLTLATPPAGIIGALLGMASRPDSTALLETITVPGAVVTGVEDALVPVERAREMALAMPDALLTVVNNAGHMPMLEQPDDVNSALRALLKRAG